MSYKQFCLIHLRTITKEPLNRIIIILSFCLFVTVSATVAQTGSWTSTSMLGTSFVMQSFTDWDDNTNPDIKVFPNPATHYIKLNDTEGVGSVEIYNLLGRKVRSYNSVTTDTQMDVEDLPRGMYLVRIMDEQGDLIVTKRLNKR